MTAGAYIDACIVRLDDTDDVLVFDIREFDILVTKLMNGETHFQGRGGFGEDIYLNLTTVSLVIRRTAQQWRDIDAHTRAREVTVE